MQDVYFSFLILCIAASSFGIGHGQKVFNVVDFGAIGDGQIDDTNVYTLALLTCIHAFVMLISQQSIAICFISNVWLLFCPSRISSSCHGRRINQGDFSSMSLLSLNYRLYMCMFRPFYLHGKLCVEMM
jgi:hypothetical protein